MKHAFGAKNWQESVMIYGVFGLTAYAGFHGLLSTWAISNVGGDLLLTSLKDMVAVLIGLVAIWHYLRQPKKSAIILKRRGNRWIGAFVVLNILWAVMLTRDLDAAAAGVLFNVRFLGLFIIGQYLALHFDKELIIKTLAKILVGSAILIAVFAVMQILFLPSDFLRHFGFGDDTIPASFFIDDNENLPRASATTRGPNPLANYLILPFALSLGMLFKSKAWHHAVISALISGAIFFTFSRSGWVASAVTVFTFLLLSVPRQHVAKFAIGSVVAGIAGTILVFSLINSVDSVSTFVLHDDPNNAQTISSTDQRLESAERSLELIQDNPIGYGPGTSGPASVYNENMSGISDSHYLQIATEVGLVGLAMFVGIMFMVARGLFRGRENIMSRAIFASFIGLLVANLFLHSWVDDEVAYTFWVLAGLVYQDEA